MTLSKLECQRETILHLWNEGICNGHEINRLTNIPVSTVYDNIAKLKKNGTVEHKKGNGHPKKITGNSSKALGQFI